MSDQIEIRHDMGLDIPDLATAWAEALNAVARLRAAMDEAGVRWTGWRLNVISAEGDVLCSLNFGTPVDAGEVNRSQRLRCGHPLDRFHSGTPVEQ